MSIEHDPAFEEVTIAEVREEDGGWSIKRSDGWSFFVPKTSPVVPAIGMTARFYGKGIGFVVRGLVIDGQTVFYRTEAQQKALAEEESRKREQEQKYDFKKNRAAMDRRYRALPEVFQRRLDKFRTNNPDFRWRFEGYEMFCCEQAVVIADAMLAKARSETQAAGMTVEEVAAIYVKHFHGLEWEQQKLVVPAISDGHSGNTFGCAVTLAVQYLSVPENVVKMYGAMAPLVGSEEYGCVPKGVK